MKIIVPMTEKRLKSFTKSESCGIVRGLSVRVVKLSDGSLAKYFVLRIRTIERLFTLGKYPDMSLSEAFKKAADWREKIAQGIDPAAEERAKLESLRRNKVEEHAPDVLTFEKLIYD